MSDHNLPVLDFNGVSLAVPRDAPGGYNPNFGEINYLESSANSWYNGFTAAFQRRFSAGLQTQIAYTFSRAISEVDGADTGNHVGAGGGGGFRYPHERSTSRGLSGYQVQNAFVANYSYDLPFGQGMTGVAGKVLSGWQMTGIITLQDGGPFSLRSASPRAIADFIEAAAPNAISSAGQDTYVRPREEWTSLGYFNLDGFAAPGCVTPGNCPATRTTREIGNLGRNTLIGPGLSQWDMGLTKNTQLGEQFNLQFRAELFNFLNHVNFAQPGQVGNSSQSNEMYTRDGAPIPAQGIIRKTATTSRQIQFGLKLQF
jgi:hypothetical protein